MTIRLIAATSDPAAAQALAAAFAGHDFLTAFVDNARALADELEHGTWDCALIDARTPEPAAAIEAARARRGGLAVCRFSVSGGAPRADDGVPTLAWPPTAAARTLIAELALRATHATSTAVPVRPPAAPAAPVIERSATPGVLVPTEQQPVDLKGRGTVAQALLELSRLRTTGVLVLRRSDAETRVCFVEGTVRGAFDNSHDNRLDTRLLRSGRLQAADALVLNEVRRTRSLRLGEAAIELGLLTNAQLATELHDQAFDRLVLAMSWTEGRMSLSSRQVEIEALDTTTLDLQEAIIRWFVRRPDGSEINRWLQRHMTNKLTPSLDVESALAAYGRLAVRQALVPLLVRTRDTPLHAVFRPVPGSGDDRLKVISHMHALWQAAAFFFDGEVAPTTALPAPTGQATPTSASGGPTATTAQGAAKLDAEVALLEAKVALDAGDLQAAIARLDTASKLSSDAEIVAWSGWVRFLEAAERIGEAVSLLKRAHHANPAAARPLIFLGLVAEQQADLATASRHLHAAARLVPDDAEVQRAIERIDGMLG